MEPDRARLPTNQGIRLQYRSESRRREAAAARLPRSGAEPTPERHRKFRANRSMRDVEAERQPVAATIDDIEMDEDDGSMTAAKRSRPPGQVSPEPGGQYLRAGRARSTSRTTRSSSAGSTTGLGGKRGSRAAPGGQARRIAPDPGAAPATPPSTTKTRRSYERA